MGFIFTKFLSKAVSLLKKTGLVFVLSLFLSVEMMYAQVYPSRTRSSSLDWHTLTSESFVVIYPEEARRAAIQTAYILEDQYPILLGRFGGELSKFPILLNTRNSLSNGYVATFPYRSEIEVRPLKGKTLNPASGSWLETVVPHELVHAVHYQMKPGFSLTNSIGVFSPDLRRSVHGMVPVGLHEGVAVDYETHGVFSESAFLYGRGSYPYFSGRFDLALIEEPWTLGQLFHVSAETLPYDRHYAGGYEFMSWVRETYGQEVVTNSILEHYRKPFLGYGLALRNQTGKWPSELYKEFNQKNKVLVNERLRATSTPEKERWKTQARLLIPGGNSSNDHKTLFKSTFTGVQFNRPVWITNSLLLVHGRFYNASSGFYEIVIPEKNSFISPVLVHEALSVSDYQVGFSADSSEVLFTRLVPSMHFEDEWAGVLSSFSVQKSGSKTTKKPAINPVFTSTPLKNLRSGGRMVSGFFSVFKPGSSPSSLYGITQNKAITAALLDSIETPVIVSLDTKGEKIRVRTLENAHPSIFPIQLQAKPGDSEQVAVIAKVNGLQGLWICRLEEVYTHIQENPPLVSFLNGSVLDVSWHPFEEKVVITSDYTQNIQIYELDLFLNTLSQLSFSDGNVFEPSYSPDGRSIAFIQQTHQEQLIGIVSLDSVSQKLISEAVWTFNPTLTNAKLKRPPLGVYFDYGLESVFTDTLNWEALFIYTPDSLSIPEGWSEGRAKAGFSWVKPRLWSPVSNQIGGKNRDGGVFFASTDLLREQSYSAELTVFRDQVWWDITYRYSGFWPGFQVNSKKIPSFQTFRFATGPSSDPQTTYFTQTLLLRERGLEVSAPFEWNLSPGLHRSSSFIFQPSLESIQAVFYEGNGSRSLSDNIRLTRIGLFSSYRHQLRQNIRQIYPEKGVLFYFQSEKNFKSDTFELRVQNNTYRTTFSEKAGVRVGSAVYFPLLSKHNQSGRVLVELVRQTDNPVFSLESLTRNLITKQPLQGSNGGLFSEARLVFPLKTVDDGYLTVPVYVNSIYLQTIHQAYIPYKNNLKDGFSGKYSVFGSGIALRSRFRLSNITLDAGIGIFWDSQSKKGKIQFGMF